MSSTINLDDSLLYKNLLNNSMNTSLNSIAGDDSSSDSSISNLLQTYASALSGTGDISSLLNGGSTSDISGVLGSNSSFSSILSQYMTGETEKASQMQEKLAAVLESAKETEGDTKSYKTVQEIYDYFADQNKNLLSTLGLSGASTATGVDSGESSANAVGETGFSAVYPDSAAMDFDFDSIEEESDSMVEGLLGV